MTWASLNRRLVGILASTCLVSGALAQTTYYVDGSCGSDSWRGTSQVCAFPNGPKRTIQAGIDTSTTGDTVIVADGTYTGTGNRDLDFGGRDIHLRSESLDPGLCIIDCQGTFNVPHRGFYFHSGETADAIVEGFTIRNGWALPDGYRGGRHGGAIYCDFNSNPTINNCTITDNSADLGGGIMCGSNSGSSPTITNCKITDNSADLGSGIYSYSGFPAITNCLISGNSAVGGPEEKGGGIYCSSGSTATITNCTITGNSAGDGGGIYLRSSSGIVTLTNCILWANVPDQISDVNGLSVVTFSNVQGGWLGAGSNNIDLDPLFVADPTCGDYYLSSGSPCIDAADNTAVPPGVTTDLCGNPRFVDDPNAPNTGVPGNGFAEIVDMGAYEFQGEVCYPDCDGSGTLDIFDFLCFQNSFVSGEPYACDCDPDPVCDIFDFLCFQNAFVSGCP